MSRLRASLALCTLAAALTMTSACGPPGSDQQRPDLPTLAPAHATHHLAPASALPAVPRASVADSVQPLAHPPATAQDGGIPPCPPGFVFEPQTGECRGVLGGGGG